MHSSLCVRLRRPVSRPFASCTSRSTVTAQWRAVSRAFKGQQMFHRLMDTTITTRGSARFISSASTVAAPPSAREVHQVVQRALEQGRRVHAVDLFLGALQLRCVPLAETYELLLSSTIRHSGWRAVVDLIDEIGGSALAVRTLYHTVGDLYLLQIQGTQGHGEEAETLPLLYDLFSVMEEAAVRHITLSARHRVPVWEALVTEDGQVTRLLEFYKTHMAPSGVVLSMEERLLLLRAAALDGDWACATQFYRQWPAGAASQAAAQVLYIGSFTRALEKRAETAPQTPESVTTEGASPRLSAPLIPWQEAVRLLVYRSGSDLDARVVDALARLNATAERTRMPPADGANKKDADNNAESTVDENAPASSESKSSFSAATLIDVWQATSLETACGAGPSLGDVRTRIATSANALSVLRELLAVREGQKRSDAQVERTMDLVCRVLLVFPSLYVDVTLANDDDVHAEAAVELMRPCTPCTMHSAWCAQQWAPTSVRGSCVPQWKLVLDARYRQHVALGSNQEDEVRVYGCVLALRVAHSAWLAAPSALLASEAAAAHTRCLAETVTLAKSCRAESPLMRAALAALVHAAITTHVSWDEVTQTRLNALCECVVRRGAVTEPRVLAALLEEAAVRGDAEAHLRSGVGSADPAPAGTISAGLRAVAVQLVLTAVARPSLVDDPARREQLLQDMRSTLEVALRESGDVEAALRYAMPQLPQNTRPLRQVVVPLLVHAQQWAPLEPLLALCTPPLPDVPSTPQSSEDWLSMQQAELCVAQNALRRAVCDDREKGDAAVSLPRDPDDAHLVSAWRRYYQASQQFDQRVRQAQNHNPDGQHKFVHTPSPPPAAPTPRLPRAVLVRIGVRLAVCDRTDALTDLLTLLDPAASVDAAHHGEQDDSNELAVVFAEALQLYVALRVAHRGVAAKENSAVAAALETCQRKCTRLALPEIIVALSVLTALAVARRTGEVEMVVPVLASAAQQSALWTERYAYQPQATAPSENFTGPVMRPATAVALVDLVDVVAALAPHMTKALEHEVAATAHRSPSPMEVLMVFYMPMVVLSRAAVEAWVNALLTLQDRCGPHTMTHQSGDTNSRAEGREPVAARVRAASARLAWRLYATSFETVRRDGAKMGALGQCDGHGWGRQPLPCAVLLTLLEACTRHGILTHAQWQQVRLQLVGLAARLPCEEGAAAEASAVSAPHKRLDALFDITMRNLAMLGAWDDALACVPLRSSPLATANVTKDAGGVFTATDAVACLRRAVDNARQRRATSALLQQEMLVALGLSARSSSPTEHQVRTPRELLVCWLELGAWEESLGLLQLVLALRARADDAFIQSEAVALVGTNTRCASLWTLREVEACVEIELVTAVMALVCSSAPWRTSWRAWGSVRSALPFVDWSIVVCAEGENIGKDDALTALFNAMYAQAAAPHELLDGILHITTEWGLPMCASWLQAVVRTLRDQHATHGALTAAENIMCVERLRRLRHHATEQHVTALVEAIITTYFGVDVDEREASSHVGVPPQSSTSSPFAALAATALAHPTHLDAPFHVAATAPGANSASVDLLSEKTMDALTLLAPLIVLATPHQLEKIAATWFTDGPRLHAMELRPLLSREAHRVRQGLASLPVESASHTWLLDQLAGQQAFVVRLAGLVGQVQQMRFTIVPVTLVEAVQRDIFDGLIATRTAELLVQRTLAAAQARHRCRWSPLVEQELRAAVMAGHAGKLPVSLRTAPRVSKDVIGHYWRVFHHVLAPELHLEGTELCCLAAYAPYVTALRRRASTATTTALGEEKRGALRELAAAVQAVHMTPSSGSLTALAQPPTTPWHRPAYVVDVLFTHSHKLLNKLCRDLQNTDDAAAKRLRQAMPTVFSPSAHATPITPTTARQLLAELLDLPAEAYGRVVADTARTVTRMLPASSASASASCAVVRGIAHDVCLSALLAVMLSWVSARQRVPDEVSLMLVEVVKDAVDRGGVNASAAADETAVHVAPRHATPTPSLLTCLTKRQRDRLAADMAEAHREERALRDNALWRVWEALDKVNAWAYMQPLHVSALHRAVMPTAAMIDQLPAKAVKKRQQTAAGHTDHHARRKPRECPEDRT